IVHWPAGLPRPKGSLCHDVGHVIDFAPTVLELAGAQAIDKHNGVQRPTFPGKSLVPAFAKDGVVTHDEIYFHHQGHKAIRMGNWKAVYAAEGKGWELYDLGVDRCEAKDLATAQPDRVRQMTARWQALDEQWRRDANKGGK